MKIFTYTIKYRYGLDMHYAIQLTSAAWKVESDCTVTKGDKTVSLKSSAGILSLCARCGDTVTFTINGPDEDTALALIEEAVETPPDYDQNAFSDQ